MDARLSGETMFRETPFGPLSSRSQTIWHKSAPGAVRKAFRSGKDSKGWSAWTKHLARREEPLPLSELLSVESSPLTWGLPDGAEDRGTAGLVEEIDRLGSKGGVDEPSPERMVLGWLADAAGSSPDAGYALEALAWCHALPRLAKQLAPEVWWDLLEHLLGAVSDARGIPLDDEPVIHQLLAGELPLAISHLFPEIAPCRELTRPARRALSAGLVDLLDGEGLPHARHLRLLRPLLACWTRCRAMGDGSAKGAWTGPAQTQYEWLVRHALRLTRYDGTHAFSRGRSGAWCGDLFEAALHFGGDRDDDEIAALVLPGSKRAGAERIDPRRLPKEAIHSEWAAVGVLRAGWAPAAPWLVATYPQESVQIELQCRRELVWSGLWGLEVRRDGEPIRPDSCWEELCWVSDDDVDYLELEIQLEGGLRVQRHLLLAREDEFLFLADAILGDRPARLEYRGCLPLAKGVFFHPAEETREGFLTGDRRLASVLPLALGEWRADASRGSLVETKRGLELCQQARGRSMFAPLLVDLRPGRMTRPLTWRHLTVAEDLRAQPSDVAVGYRVTIGKHQWLIYRSLAPTGNRTLLGHNLTTEMLVARFDRDGEVEPLVEIESD
ncbi:MAG TPA: hypothetical protein VMY37_23450 [Thermoguttaceae bacterium]|nr:hypothetical protein [Thermoguttaceae bacterium]